LEFARARAQAHLHSLGLQEHDAALLLQLAQVELQALLTGTVVAVCISKVKQRRVRVGLDFVDWEWVA